MKNLVEEAKKVKSVMREDPAGYEYALLAVAVLNREVSATQASVVMGKKQVSQCVSKMWFALSRAVRQGKIIVQVK